MPAKILVTTGNHVEGRQITEYLDVVRGIVVRAAGIDRGQARFRSMAWQGR